MLLRAILAWSAAILSVLAVSSAFAHSYHAGALTIGHPWCQPTPNGAPTAICYLSLSNAGANADRLTGGATPAAAGLSVHEMSMAGGVMRMREITGGLQIAPGETVALAPGGDRHIMLTGLKRALHAGQRVHATLKFAKGGSMDVEFTVEAAHP